MLINSSSDAVNNGILCTIRIVIGIIIIIYGQLHVDICI